jgi:hypothetical protein
MDGLRVHKLKLPVNMGQLNKETVLISGKTGVNHVLKTSHVMYKPLALA